MDILNEQGAAELLDCSTETVQEKARNGELPAVKYGRSWVFPRQALLDVLNRKALENVGRHVRATARAVVPAKRQPPALPQA